MGIKRGFNEILVLNMYKSFLNYVRKSEVKHLFHSNIKLQILDTGWSNIL